jgi:hypothetical protein
MPEPAPFITPLRLTPTLLTFFPNLPGGILGGLGSTPLSRRGRSSRGSATTSGSSVPGTGLSLAPLTTTSSGEASRGGIPVTTSSGVTGLDSDNAFLLNTGELVFLDLVLSLGLRVAVFRSRLARSLAHTKSKGNIQKYKSTMTSQGVSRL